MKTLTYARLSLLIPLLLWLIFLLVELLINAVIPAEQRSNGPTTFVGVLEVFILFYLIGIIVWFLPYLVLAIALLVLSFRSRLEMLRYLFLLSPFAMAILAMLEATIISLPIGDYARQSSGFASDFMTSVGINLMMGILSLVYGYICVGIGFGGYKLLQRANLFRDEIQPQAEPIMSGDIRA